MQLDVDLDSTVNESLNKIHLAFLCVQRTVYERRGTIRQLIQDDKGLVIIAVFGDKLRRVIEKYTHTHSIQMFNDMCDCANTSHARLSTRAHMLLTQTQMHAYEDKIRLAARRNTFSN